ncbi:hypothetical protein BIW11_11995 [Tropilaelaps mercedesae]|uniref:Uncharacterized protein n=1 Tax=Tropilaelaps mercedesae TaxID=418985 RepID=A0A1V9X8K5_9ACAR|nr:hypothetical protein BIW11_11995 [Tropilaelaps mercedesae]
MGLPGASWLSLEDFLLDLWYVPSKAVEDINNALNAYDFLPMLAVCLWHTDPVSVPSFTRLFALTSLTAACYSSAFAKENYDDTLGSLVHDIIGSLFFYASTLDAFFCILSFVYKGIILEARMGARRFFNMVFLLATSIGSLKFLLAQINVKMQGGMYPLLLSLKVVINYTCLFHHPIRFPVLHPFLTRRLRFFEFFIALVRSRSPQDVLIGVAAGASLIACLNDPNSFIHPLLGEDGSKVTTVSATKLIFRGRSGGAYRWVKTVSPNIVTGVWLAVVILSYSYRDAGLSFFEPLSILETFNPVHPITWVLPTYGVTSATHLCYLLFLVYRTPTVIRAAFKDTTSAVVCFFGILPMSRTLSLILLNISYDCDMLSMWCLDFSKRYSDSCSVLLAANAFAGIVVLTPETAGTFIVKLSLEMTMIWKFFPEIHLLSILGAYGAAGLFACISLLVDRGRIHLADPMEGIRKADIILKKNPRRQFGSVTESSTTTTVSKLREPPADATWEGTFGNYSSRELPNYVYDGGMRPYFSAEVAPKVQPAIKSNAKTVVRKEVSTKLSESSQLTENSFSGRSVHEQVEPIVEKSYKEKSESLEKSITTISAVA